MRPDPFRRNERGCRCRESDDGMEESYPPALPPASCGWCEVCGRAGHRRRFPGIVPMEGTWCDAHFEQLRCAHPFGEIGVVRWGVGVWSLVGLCVYVFIL